MAQDSKWTLVQSQLLSVAFTVLWQLINLVVGTTLLSGDHHGMKHLILGEAAIRLPLGDRSSGKGFTRRLLLILCLLLRTVVDDAAGPTRRGRSH